jgi:hypothetical protein
MLQLLRFTALSALLICTSATPYPRPSQNTRRELTVSSETAPALSECTGAAGKALGEGKGHKGAKGHGKGSSNAKAIYFITNAAQNSIVALKVAPDGKVSDGSITPTGGAGMNGIENGAPAAPDSLFSQGAVKVAGNVRLQSHRCLKLTLTLKDVGSCQSRLEYNFYVLHLLD